MQLKLMYCVCSNSTENKPASVIVRNSRHGPTYKKAIAHSLVSHATKNHQSYSSHTNE